MIPLLPIPICPTLLPREAQVEQRLCHGIYFLHVTHGEFNDIADNASCSKGLVQNPLNSRLSDVSRFMLRVPGHRSRVCTSTARDRRRRRSDRRPVHRPGPQSSRRPYSRRRLHAAASRDGDTPRGDKWHFWWGHMSCGGRCRMVSLFPGQTNGLWGRSIQFWICYLTVDSDDCKFPCVIFVEISRDCTYKAHVRMIWRHLKNNVVHQNLPEASYYYLLISLKVWFFKTEILNCCKWYFNEFQYCSLSAISSNYHSNI